MSVRSSAAGAGIAPNPADRPLAEFSRPEGGDDTLAEQYAIRDCEAYPNKTIANWRKEIDSMLEKGEPYGKSIGWEHNRGALEPLFQQWRDALVGMPKSAPPAQVYGAAPEKALVWLGY